MSYECSKEVFDRFKNHIGGWLILKDEDLALVYEQLGENYEYTGFLYLGAPPIWSDSLLSDWQKLEDWIDDNYFGISNKIFDFASSTSPLLFFPS